MAMQYKLQIQDSAGSNHFVTFNMPAEHGIYKMIITLSNGVLYTAKDDDMIGDAQITVDYYKHTYALNVKISNPTNGQISSIFAGYLDTPRLLKYGPRIEVALGEWGDNGEAVFWVYNDNDVEVEARIVSYLPDGSVNYTAASDKIRPGECSAVRSSRVNAIAPTGYCTASFYYGDDTRESTYYVEETTTTTTTEDEAISDMETIGNFTLVKLKKTEGGAE